MNKINYIFCLTVMFLFCTFMQSCYKEDPCLEFSSFIHSPMRNYLFLPGTYWVYTSNSGQTDSQYVYSYKHAYQITPLSTKGPGIDSEVDCGNDYMELYYMYIEDFTPSKYYPEITMPVSGGSLGLFGYNFDNSGVGTGIFGDDTVGYYGGVSYAKYDSLLVHSIYYHQVERFRCRADLRRPLFDDVEYITDFYFCPRVGIVRKVEYPNSTDTIVWDLTAKQINNY